MSAPVIKLRLTPRLLAHGYLNGFGFDEQQCELERERRRLNNTVAALKRREQAVSRLMRMRVRRQMSAAE